MSNPMRIIIVVALALVVGVVVARKQRAAPPAGPDNVAAADATAPASPTEPRGLPRLVDLGASKCIPCKMMAPILQELKKEYVGRMQVEFIDVWEHRGAGEKYGIKSIPTQIFYDAAGKELYRHEGFISKADILAKWKELGVRMDM